VSPSAFDKYGNYAIGIREQIIFPEVDYDEVDMVRGLDVVFTISGNSVEGSRALLKHFGMPFAQSAAAAKGAGY
jgi:large subunit ribosomal protein L5